MFRVAKAFGVRLYASTTIAVAGFRNNLNTANLRGRAVLCASHHTDRDARCDALWPQMLLAVATEDVRLYTLFLPLEP